VDKITGKPMSKQNIFNNKDSNSLEVVEDNLIAKETKMLPVLYLPATENKVDYKCISKKYYNSFNFSKLASTFSKSKMTIGITSAGRRDGKTLVAANMAVSLAAGYNQKTVLVDMNFHNPDMHRVFGTDLTPGLSDAIASEKIRVVPSGIENLFLMTAGSSKNLTPGIEHTLTLRKILFTLISRFDFVIIDMGSILPIEKFPIHFINEIDGLIGVIDTKKTKKGEFNKIFKHLDEDQFIGYVFNRVDNS
jgi:Mrp family chromosome partitioning ATPase